MMSKIGKLLRMTRYSCDYDFYQQNILPFMQLVNDHHIIESNIQCEATIMLCYCYVTVMFIPLYWLPCRVSSVNIYMLYTPFK